MIVSIILSLCACGSSQKTDVPQATETSSSEPSSEVSTSAPEAKSEKQSTTGGADEPADITVETIVPQETNTNTKKVYWATKDKDSSDVAYHTKDCTLIKDKEPEVLPWEIINTLGMPACEICNP